MVSLLWQKTNYTNRDIDYLKNVLITEYDISSAGMNILYDLGVITSDKYEILKSMKKHDRVVAIGYLLKDPKMKATIEFGFRESRRIFMEQNNLEDGSILSIKKDAIFLINKNAGINGVISPHIEFKKKSTYNSFMQINKKEHYLNFSRENSSLTVKGYPQAVKELHKDYLFKFLKDMMVLDLLGASKKEIFIELLKFKDAFITRSLDKNYYKDLLTGTFPYLSPTKVYGIPNLDTSVIPLEDIDYRINLDFILTVINLLLSN